MIRQAYLILYRSIDIEVRALKQAAAAPVSTLKCLPWQHSVSVPTSAGTFSTQYSATFAEPFHSRIQKTQTRLSKQLDPFDA